MNLQSNMIIKERIESLGQALEILGEQIEAERRNESSDENLTLQELLDKKEILLGELEQLESPTEEIAGSSSDQLGRKYTVEINGLSKKFEVVIPTEANPTEGLISSQSPLVQALFGKKKGDIVQVKTPVGKSDYKIIATE